MGYKIRFMWKRNAPKVALITTALCLKFFIISTALIIQNAEMRAMTRDLITRQAQLEQLVAVVAPLKQMQAMAARFEKHGWKPEAASKIVAVIFQVARELHIDPLLIEAIIIVESAYNPLAVSHKGAKGLMQLMPCNVAPGEDPFDPIFNVKKGSGVFVGFRREGRGVDKTFYRYNGWDPRKAPCQDNIAFAADVAAAYTRLRAL